MSPVRTSLLLATLLTLTGCYDLSAPTGPGPDDFAKNSATAQTDLDDDACTGDDCPAESALTTRAAKPADPSSDAVVANDATRHALEARRK